MTALLFVCIKDFLMRLTGLQQLMSNRKSHILVTFNEVSRCKSGKTLRLALRQQECFYMSINGDQRLKMCLCYKEFEYVDRVHSECSNDGSQMGNARLLLAAFINYDCCLSSVTRITSLYSRTVCKLGIPQELVTLKSYMFKFFVRSPVNNSQFRKFVVFNLLAGLVAFGQFQHYECHIFSRKLQI